MMISKKMKRLRLGLALLGAGSALAVLPAAAGAQQQGVYREDAGTALTRHLRTLSDQPRSLSALTGAGKAALDLGDPQAALTFFARAEEVAPRDGRVKAGMGSAFLAMEQPDTAMRFFIEAASLGAPEAEYAGDRGLVHDLAGDPRRAQADYALALRRGEDDEIRRRLALSLAISGERDRALATLDPQLRRQDRAAWRTRAFILALSGDARGATSAAEATMPQQAAQMQPFFAKLPGLSPAQRAMAVHFGHFPGDGQPTRTAGTQYASAAPTPPQTTTATAPTQAGRPDAGQAALGTRRRPATTEPDLIANSRIRRPQAEQPRQERRSPATRTASRTEQRPIQVPVAPIETAAIAPAPVPAPTPALTAPAQAPASGLGQVSQIIAAQRDETPPVAASQAPAPSVTQPVATLAQTPPPAPAPVQTAPIQTTSLPPSIVSIPEPARQEPGQAPAEPAASTFANIAAAIASLPEEQPSVAPPPQRPVQLAEAKTIAPAPAVSKAQKPSAAEADTAVKKQDADKAAADKAAAAKKDAAAKKEALAKKEAAEKKEAVAKKEAATKKEATTKEAAAKKEAAPKEPSRHWVQVAGGANEAAMASEFKRLKDKAPKLLAARTAWTTPLRATNRLLVGPFKTPAEAQEFVNQLSKLDLPAFSWTSPAGQEIVKLAAK
jgi:hypothetical protein